MAGDLNVVVVGAITNDDETKVQIAHDGDHWFDFVVMTATQEVARFSLHEHDLIRALALARSISATEDGK